MTTADLHTVGAKQSISSRSAAGRLASGTAVFALLTFFIPLTITHVPGAGSTASTLLQWIVVAYPAAHLAVIFACGEPRWLDAMMWTFSYIWIGLAGLVQLSEGRNPYNVAHADSSYQTAAVIAITGMVAYDLGRRIGDSARWRSTSRPPRQIDKRRTLLLAAAAILTTPLLIQYLGGLQTLFVSRTTRAEILANSGLRTDESAGPTAIAITLMVCVPLMAALACIRLTQSNPKLRGRLGWLLLLATLIAIVLLVANPIASSRFWTGTAYMAVAITVWGTSRPGGFRTLFAAAFAVLLLAFPYADYFRYDNYHTELQSVSSIMTTKGDYDTASQMVSVVDYVAQDGHTSGTQTLGALTFYVPRILWTDKPDATGPVLARYIRFPEENLSAPLWVEGYIDGGYLLVGAFFVMFGVAASLAQARLLSARLSKTSLSALLLPPVSAYSLIILRGSLMTMMGGLVAIVVIGWLVTKKTDESTSKNTQTSGNT